MFSIFCQHSCCIIFLLFLEDFLKPDTKRSIFNLLPPLFRYLLHAKIRLQALLCERIPSLEDSLLHGNNLLNFIQARSTSYNPSTLEGTECLHEQLIFYGNERLRIDKCHVFLKGKELLPLIHCCSCFGQLCFARNVLSRFSLVLFFLEVLQERVENSQLEEH